MDKNNLEQKLLKDHVQIIELCKQLQLTDPKTPNLKTLLKALKTEIAMHLYIEDNKLYPKLREKAKRNPELKKLYLTFLKGMEKNKDYFKWFFKKYEDGIKNNFLDWKQDFRRFDLLLNARIRREENILYPNFFAKKNNRLVYK